MNDSLKKAFEQAATENYWSDKDSVSGPGSNLIQTRVIRQEIPKLLKNYGIKKMLDAPCGDLFWMKELREELSKMLVQYIGADIVPSLVESNRQKYEDKKFSFVNLDIIHDQVPNVDLIFTRDCFIHLSYSNILAILRNYENSGSKYLLVSTYTRLSRKNKNVDGFFLYGRMLNMSKFPFYFPKPLELIVEGCTEVIGDENFTDKSLGLWRLSDLNLNRLYFNIRLLALYKKAELVPLKINRFLKSMFS